MPEENCESPSVTGYFRLAKENMDPQAVAKLYEFFFSQLERVAQNSWLPKYIDDPQDLAQVTLTQFFLRLQQGKHFPKMEDRHDLWQVLKMILERRIIDAWRRSKAHPLEGESAIILKSGDVSQPVSLNQVPDVTPTVNTPEGLEAELRDILGCLPSEEWRQIISWKIQMYTHAEIAQKLNCSIGRVEYVLRQVRKNLEKNMDWRG